MHLCVSAFTAPILWLTKHRATFARDLAHFSQTLFLEFCIPYCQHFIDNQDLRFQMRRYRECQPNVHAGRIALHRCVEEALYLGERNNFIELLADFTLRHAKDRTVQENVFATCQLRMKPGPDLEKARDTSPEQGTSPRRLRDAAEDFQKRALAGAVSADDAEHLALLDLEAHIPQRPEFLHLIALNDLPPPDQVSRLACEVASSRARSRRATPYNAHLGGPMT